MAIWRYTAINRSNVDGAATRHGELAADSAADARAALRRIGLIPLRLAPHTPPTPHPTHNTPHTEGTRATATHSRVRQLELISTLLTSFRRSWFSHLRKRRRAERAEIGDGLATMLESGLPLLEAIDTLLGDNPASNSFFARIRSLTGEGGRRAMLLSLREQLRGGQSLDQALACHPSWFDAAEVAMVRAAMHGGTLPTVLRSIALQHERADQLGQKLAAALTYPAVIALVGLGVVAFLSTKTLPDLAGILTSSDLEVPRLTEWVMWCGRVLVDYWPALLMALALATLAGFLIPGMQRVQPHTKTRVRSLMPQVLRRMAVAGMSVRLAELIRSGVPMVEAMRVIAPAVRGASLRHTLENAANRLERGEELASVLDSPVWFDAEYRRLIEIGQSSGELDRLLERIGERYQRRAERLIARLAALLEPAVILLLAALIGLVAMAAVLPLVRLRDVL